jgi:contractile injection system tube protein
LKKNGGGSDVGTKNLNMAYITPVTGCHAGTRYEVLFNPAEYSIEKGNTFQSTSLPGLSTPVTQFVTGNADTLSMELYFDTYAKSSRQGNVVLREDVRRYTRPIANLMEIDPTLHAPPVCEFTWGPALGTPAGIQFRGILEKVSQKFTYFLDDGTPVRATLNVTFKEYKTVEQQLAEMKCQSTDRTKRREFKEGDSLWHLASTEYNDPQKWKVIADHNQLDNPRLIAPGFQLELPPLT